MINKDDSIPCKFCSQPTFHKGTKCCNNCWEVSQRFSTFIRSIEAQQFVINELLKCLKKGN
jgi:hypothetical protein